MNAGPVTRALARWNYPFKYRLHQLMVERGWIHGSIIHKIDGLDFEVPAEDWHWWNMANPLNYQPKRIEVFVEVMKKYLLNPDLIDLGADIGTVSRVIYARHGDLRSIRAVEPNPQSFAYLKRNLDCLPIPHEALNVAVSDRTGKASMVAQGGIISDHSGYIEVADSGEVTMLPLDDIVAHNIENLALKIDVEGQEHAVFRGGRRLLGQARSVVMFMEVHRSVSERTGISPDSIMAEAEKIRPCSWFLAEAKLPPVDRSRSFFSQFPELLQHDLIGVMHN